MSTTTTLWTDANQAHLAAALGRLRAMLEAARDGAAPVPPAPEPAWTLPDPPALDRVAGAFGLSAFERDVLLLCAAAELDAAFGPLFAALHGDAARPNPTFGLALAALPDAHWSALVPTAPLRRWRLVEVGAAPTLTSAPLRIDERVLHFLAGVDRLDERLAGVAEPVFENGALPPSHAALAGRLAAAWTRADAAPSAASAPTLCGPDADARRAVAHAAAERLGLRLFAVNAHALPAAPAEIEPFLRLWEREAALGGCALLVECDGVEAGDAARALAVRAVAERLRGPVVLSARERRAPGARPGVVIDVGPIPADEQRALWAAALGARGVVPNGEVARLAGTFALGAATIRAAADEAFTALPDDGAHGGAHGGAALGSAPLGDRLWDAVRAHARPRLDDLAQRIDPRADWDDLVLPDAQTRTLREIAAHAAHRATVYETWGFAAKSARGLGLSALFAGPSGTGKTLGAEVLANALRLDLYRIDLSAVVSKYIGETEKNLRRVFDAAEAGGAILLFDEADALFGKRSDVKDAHDRYANVEVSYLLQRIEAYCGLAILTTNRRADLDAAFLRRLRFVVEFPFPTPVERARIWARAFPAATPTEGLDIERLARLNVAGGHIRNVALGAAFLAAADGEPVAMKHLARAARTEYTKLERPLTEAEIGGWL